MTARHGIYLLLVSQLLKIGGEVFGIFHLPGVDFFWGISSALWTLGIVLLLYKVLTYEKWREFLDR
jgi:hypothetical protein